MAAEKNKAPALSECHNYSLKSLLEDAQKQYLEDSFSHNSCYVTGTSTGFESQGQNCASKGPFSPSQLVEFHRQMMINYHIMYNFHVPPDLLIGYEKSIEQKGSKKLSYTSGGSGSSDPDRCHRTDGKKWRCSRNRVHDKRYCELHLKRSQHHAKRYVERTREKSAKKHAQRTGGNAASKYCMMMNSGASNELQVIQQANQSSEIGSIDVGNINRFSVNTINVGGEIQNPQIASDESFNLQFGFPSSESFMEPLQLYLGETFGQLERDQYLFLHDFIDEFSIENENQVALNFPEMQASEPENLFPPSSIHRSLALEPSLPLEQFIPVPVGVGGEIQNSQIASDESFNLQFGFPSPESIMEPLQLYLDETFDQLVSDQYLILEDSIYEFSIENENQVALNFPETQASEIHNLFPLPSIHGSLAIEPSMPSEQFLLPVSVGLGVEDALDGTVGNQINISSFSCEGSIGGPLGEIFNSHNNNSEESKQFDGTTENNNSKESKQFDATAENNKSKEFKQFDATVEKIPGIMQDANSASHSSNSQDSSSADVEDKVIDEEKFCMDLLARDSHE